MTLGVTRTHTVVIGAGPAGLAVVGACLGREGVPFVLLERADRVGATWHRHYRRLHLHTDKRRSHLPFLPFPEDVPHYPSRAQVIAYLKAYARRFGREPRFGQEVVSVGRRDGHWETRTRDACYRPPAVVVATRHAREPHRPTWPGQDAFRGPILHRSSTAPSTRTARPSGGSGCSSSASATPGARSPSTSGSTAPFRASPSAARSTSCRATSSASRS